MIKRLRAKFVCINMALVMVMLIVILVMVYQSTAAVLENDSINTLKAAATTQTRPGRPGQMTPMCFTLEKGPWGTLIAVGGDYFDLSDTDMLLDIYELARDQDTQLGVLKKYSLRFYRSEGYLGELYVFTDISAERATLDNLIKTCVLIGVTGFFGFLLISILLARWAVKPVEKAWLQQRQFVADASHELKTPLTVILTNAELLQSEDYPPEEKRKFSDSILTMSRQMRGLVESLLELARVDNGRAKADRTRIDLSRMTEEAVLPFEPVYFERGLTLESIIEPGISVMGNERYLRQVAEILLDNGQKYSAAGGTALLTLTHQGRRALLKFHTPGTPLTPEQCRDIFKRFYRADEARAMSGSYGLGLSIAQRVVTDHGGKIWAQGEEKGNSFFVSLPEA
ncbi:MAG: HAMP domain-containing histidine kinase [Oscillospiraceae bacterium]|nr:HAMP domain-containing histidine kinase [Oscillospiraceae bacterium]